VGEVKVVGLTGFRAVAEHRADIASVRDTADGTVGILGTGQVWILRTCSNGDTASCTSRTIRISLTGETWRVGTFALHATERFAVFHARVIDTLIEAVTPIDHDLAEWHLVMCSPGVETHGRFV